MLSRYCLKTPHLQTVLNQRIYHSDKYIYGFRRGTVTPEETAEKGKQLLSDLSLKRKSQPNLWGYISAYRNHGHRIAKINPLSDKVSDVESVPELHCSLYLDDTGSLDASGLLYSPPPDSQLGSLTSHLHHLYCDSISAEFEHIEDPIEKEWFAEAFENRDELFPVTREDQIRFAQLLLKSQVFDNYLGNKFTTVKRYSGEGAESLLICCDAFLRSQASSGVEAAVIAIPHRGRNNLLTVLLNYPPSIFFRKMKGKSEFPTSIPSSIATGDTFSHFYQSTDLAYPESGSGIHVSLIPNPSHLEANVSVAVGKVRSKMQTLKDADYLVEDTSESIRNGDKAVCIQIHGDASVTGQGIVPETLAMAYLPNFNVGGSFHIVINNQVGFTTESERGRSFRYCSDVARVIKCPVLHVNGEDPEAVSKAARLAAAYRQKFRREIVLDLVCYRRWGHNELDDPSITQPLMYAKIGSLATTPDRYFQKLVADGVCSKEDVSMEVDKWTSYLAEEASIAETFDPPMINFQKQWSSMLPDGAKDAITVYNTGLEIDALKDIGRQSVTVPAELNIHPNVKKTFVDRRLERIETGIGMDWATAEALAVGSLLKNGNNVRISGQDVGRGTFSHRHFMLVDQQTDKMFIPFNSSNLTGKLEVANSHLSEEAVLGFEYGMSMDNPNNLIIWEAQFGDFFNGAQIIFDTYISSGETKWLHQNGIVILLPHGYDGAGPEHSSCRLERFLQMTDSHESVPDTDLVNMHIIYPTTPAQYFHALRRQMIRPFRKPLIVAAPKVLLRSPQATLSLSDIGPGTCFHHVFPDTSVTPSNVEKVILCTGKHYYALLNHRDEKLTPEEKKKIAIIRIEQLAPFPSVELAGILKSFPAVKSFVWAQEEQRNMGAWQFVSTRVSNQLSIQLKYAGRVELATPAVGIGALHKAEVVDIIHQAFQ